MTVTSLVGSHRERFDVRSHTVLGKDIVSIDITIALASDAQPRLTDISNDIDNAQRVFSLIGSVIPRDLGVKVVGVTRVATLDPGFDVEQQF